MNTDTINKNNRFDKNPAVTNQDTKHSKLNAISRLGHEAVKKFTQERHPNTMKNGDAIVLEKDPLEISLQLLLECDRLSYTIKDTPRALRGVEETLVNKDKQILMYNEFMRNPKLEFQQLQKYQAWILECHEDIERAHKKRIEILENREAAQLFLVKLAQKYPWEPKVGGLRANILKQVKNDLLFALKRPKEAAQLFSRLVLFVDEDLVNELLDLPFKKAKDFLREMIKIHIQDNSTTPFRNDTLIEKYFFGIHLKNLSKQLVEPLKEFIKKEIIENSEEISNPSTLIQFFERLIQNFENRNEKQEEVSELYNLIFTELKATSPNYEIPMLAVAVGMRIFSSLLNNPIPLEIRYWQEGEDPATNIYVKKARNLSRTLLASIDLPPQSEMQNPSPRNIFQDKKLGPLLVKFVIKLINPS